MQIVDRSECVTRCGASGDCRNTVADVGVAAVVGWKAKVK